jgi:hypothetical protein
MTSNRPELDRLFTAQRVNDACDRFEAGWRDEVRPSIEAALAEAAEGDRVALFPELLALELELRDRAGERPDPLEYLIRFPEWAAEIGLVLGSETTDDARRRSSTATPRPSPGPAATPTAWLRSRGSAITRSLRRSPGGGWGWSTGLAS